MNAPMQGGTIIPLRAFTLFVSRCRRRLSSETNNVNARSGTIIPLRAFTLFVSEESLRRHLESERARLTKLLDRLDGKQEWTLRIEFDPQLWSEALVRRVDGLRALSDEIAAAAAGKAFLLRKKLDDEKKRASREAEH